MITKVIILSLFLFLHLATGAEYTSVQLEHHNLVAREGERLLIPCFYKVDNPSGGYQIELEWSVKPNGADTFRPIIRLDDTGYLHVSEPNERASINPMQVKKGHCSLVINPVNVDDSGTYQVRIAVDGFEKPGTEKVIVNVQKRCETDDAYTDQPVTTEAFEDAERMLSEEVIQVMKNKGQLFYLIIIIGVVAFLLALGIVAAIVFGCVNRNTGRRITDAVKLMEEGRMSKNLDNSPVIIDIEGYSQRTQQTEVTDQSLETVPTTVEMPEDIEEDTKATHLQAEEPMEFFDAATVYLSP